MQDVGVVTYKGILFLPLAAPGTKEECHDKNPEVIPHGWLLSLLPVIDYCR